MPKNTFLVVLYNTKPEESPTLKSLSLYFNDYPSKNNNIIIWDNSKKSVYSEFIDFTKKIIPTEYIHTPENTSLSKIYNTISAGLLKHSFLTLLDQDTELPEKYFQELSELQEKGEKLILPIVICKEIIVSPGYRIFSHGILFKKIASGMSPSKNMLAINSGMSISQDVFNKLKYDERLRFYGTDTYFMTRYEKEFGSLHIMSTRINHSLAEMEERDQEWKDKHLNEKIRTFKIIFTTSIIDIIFSRVHCFLLNIKHSLPRK